MLSTGRLKRLSVTAGLVAITFPVTSWANRYISCEDMGFEDCGLGGSGTFFDLGGIAILALIIFLFLKSKQFRKYLLAFALFCVAVAVAIKWIRTEFGKEGVVIAVVIVGLLYWKFEDKILNFKIFNDDNKPPQ